MRNEVSAKIALDSLIEGVLASGTSLVIDGSFHSELAPYVEKNTLAGKSPEQLATEAAFAGAKLLDFGCGTGGHRSFVESLGYNWTGLNYKAGMAKEAANIVESQQDAAIVFYDGEHIPFPAESFDIVYSFQVFEHIQNIEKTFSEIYRVLKPCGKLIGAVSYLEQIHDYSTFNFTPFGFKLAVDKSGLQLLRIYPRSDVFSFLLRRLLVVTSASDENSLSHSIHAENEISRLLSNYALSKANITEANLLRLMFSVHFSFEVQK